MDIEHNKLLHALAYGEQIEMGTAYRYCQSIALVLLRHFARRDRAAARSYSIHNYPYSQLCQVGAERMKIIRVFPRRTKATPEDPLALVVTEPRFTDEADEVHISVLFTEDIPVAERLAELWKHVAPVKIGGPAYKDHGGDFVPGMYVNKGYVITSRGCPNSCWFCAAWRSEGRQVRELPITEGHNLLDNNILACSDEHIKAVFNMLLEGKRKYRKPIEFTGGLEAARLKQWHVDELRRIKPKQLFFAYDTPDDLEPLQQAGKMLLDAGFTRASKGLRCYVLCGFKGDTIKAAQKRMEDTQAAGFLPMAMYFLDQKNGKTEVPADWKKWKRHWIRPAMMQAEPKQRETRQMQLGFA